MIFEQELTLLFLHNECSDEQQLQTTDKKRPIQEWTY